MAQYTILLTIENSPHDGAAVSAVAPQQKGR